jgi:hypothetical protein
MESAGSSPISSHANDHDTPGPDFDMESANATPNSLFTAAAVVDGNVPSVPSTSTQRALPARNVTEENIADVYAAFILYCNPYFPRHVDTSDLKRIFQTPPRSDGKDFSIYTLWKLIRKFDSKEIKTWTQLSLDLGVEPPSAERGGSVQKVQQYSVRLKVRHDMS